MPRSLKPRSELRQRFDLYLDDREVEQLRASATAARLPMSTFLRRVALRQRIHEAPSPVSVARWRELAPLAANLNQIARACNVGVAPSELEPVVAMLAEQVRMLRLELLAAGDERQAGRS